MAILCRALLILIGIAVAETANAGETWRHVVLCDGKPVGSSVLRLEGDGNELVVTTDVRVQVSLGFLTLYQYRYAGREVWRGDRLIALETKTDDNGHQMAVSGRLTPDGFRVDGIDGTAIAPQDIRPTSFWREDAVAQRRLLDTETGRILGIVATPLGNGASDRGLPLRRYRLAGDLKQPLELTYAGGRLISARLQKLGSEIEFRADGTAGAPRFGSGSGG